MLDRIAVHQTRLRVPGIGLDARGVALGTRGLVLLPSLDRLVAWLALYTADHGLDALGALEIVVVRSKLGAREVALWFDAGSSDRMDHVAAVSRLGGGFTFTGSSRHFVQYRDASAPFGFDATEIVATDADLALYHSSFSQTYAVEKKLDVASLLLRMMPHADPARAGADVERVVLAEPGLGPSLSGYFLRSGVAATAGIAEWPPESGLDDQPVRRWLFRVPSLPKRMRPLLASTPGVCVFLPVCAGAAVEEGFSHPITLRACPVFDAAGLVLFRGRGEPPLCITRLPALGDVRALARTALHAESIVAIPPGSGDEKLPKTRVPVRLLPRVGPATSIEAVLVPEAELELLRRLSYALSSELLRTTRIAVTEVGAFLLRDRGIEALPLGSAFRRVHPVIFAPSGWDVVPNIGADALHAALAPPAGRLVFLREAGTALAVDEGAFVPLERALLEPGGWAPLRAVAFTAELERPLGTPVVWFDPLGLRPLSGAPEAR